jgi:hypothetical protein
MRQTNVAGGRVSNRAHAKRAHRRDRRVGRRRPGVAAARFAHFGAVSRADDEANASARHVATLRALIGSMPPPPE